MDFGTVELLVCSHDDWKKSAGNEHYRVSGLLRKYRPPASNLLEQEQRVLFLSDPGTASSILANQLESKLAETGYLVKSFSLKKSRRLAALPPPRIAAETSQAWCLLTDLDHVRVAELASFRGRLDEFQSAGWRVALFGTQGYVATALAGIEEGASLYHTLGLASLDIQRICDQEGIDARMFRQELDRLDLQTESANPAILQTLIRRFRCRGYLPQKRSQAVRLIWRTLRKCTRVRGRHVIAAAGALGLAMELASRNALTSQEAELAIRSRLDRTSSEADSLLASVAPLLLFTPDGICFPHHSLGEFLAAAEIRSSPLSLILDYLFLSGSRNPNSSWIPAFGFLAEFRADLGSYLASHHPELALQAVFSSLTASEKDTIGETLYQRLRTRAEPLRQHPEIRASRLAQCLSPKRLKELQTETQIGTDSILVANALFLLGEAGHRESLALAREKALDTATDLAIRHAAFHALGRLGTVLLIPDLIDGVDKSDPAFVSMLVAVGSLADETVIQQVMGEALKTQTHIHSLYERLRQTDPKPTALSLLSMIRSRPNLINHPQFTFYASCLDGALRRAWDAELAEAAVGALIAIEDARVLELRNSFIEDLADAIADCDRDETVVRQALEQLAKRGRPVIAITHTLVRLASPATIRWLAETDCDESFIAALRMYARGKLYSAFEEIRPRKPSEPDPRRLAWEEEHREKVAKAEEEVTQTQAIVCGDMDFTRVWRAALFLDEERLPEVSPERNEWLATECDRLFLSMDFSLIKWAGDHSCSIPWLLAGLLVLITRYALHLANDVPLIKSLTSLRGEAAERHVRQYGLTQAGQLELEKMIADTALNASALDTVLHLVRETKLWTNGIAAALRDRALSQDLRIQRSALFTLFDLPQSTDILADLATQKVTRMPDTLFNELVKRQHRPTIERRLSQLIGDPSLLAAGEVDFPNTSPLDWIGEIREPEVWNKLQRVRGFALDNGNFRVVGTVTAAMAAIDEEQLIANMAIQIRRTPKAWRPWQRTGILESRQRVRLGLARTTSFKKVVSKLQMKSTQKRLKIWCEGVRDLPALRGFIQRTIGDRDDVVIQPIGGWSELGNPDFPFERLWDGCLDVVLVADGDNGRDWSRPDRPLSPVGAALSKRLEAIGVRGFVLQRYGLENYFSKAAVQAVLGPAVAQHFPLADDAKAVTVPGYSKGRNGEIAAAMTLDDLHGTDLHHILQEIKQRVEW